MNFVAAILYAVSSSTLLALVLAFARGGLSPALAGISLSFGACVAAVTFWKNRRVHMVLPRPAAWEWIAIVAFALITARIFLWVVFQDGDSIKVLSPNNLGDLSLHITYIRYLASGVPFWPDNPILTGCKLTYPIGIDLFNSLLVLLGADLSRSLIWTGLAGSALLGVVLWRWGRGFALLGFLANGGLAGFAILHTGRFEDFQSALAWKSIALSLLATQRGLLFALPAGLALLCSWRNRFFHAGDAEEGGWKLSRAGELLLYAAMPLFHLHTFLFLSMLLASWLLLHPPARRGILTLLGAALIPATLLVLLVTGMMKGAGAIAWNPGWMWRDADFLEWCGKHLGNTSLLTAALTFWPLNFGALPIFVFALCWKLARERQRVWDSSVVFPAVFAFLLCCFVKFAPWEWDNTKLMLWSYLAVLPFLWRHLIAPCGPWMRTAICILLFGSGFVSTLGGINSKHQGYEIARRSELDAEAVALRGIPVSERFAGAPTFNHPLLLCGRKMTMGYLGHVTSHGLPWVSVSPKVDALMNGEDGWERLAVELGARYLIWGRNEEEAYLDSEKPWKNSVPVVASGEWGEIYDLRPTR